MPSLPIPLFASAVLFFLFVRLWAIRGKLSPIAVVLAVCGIQTGILALSQHYHVPGMRLVQPITATVIPPVAWLAFRWTAVRSARRADLLHLLLPATAISALITAPNFLDVLVPAAFFIYGCAILFQSRKGPDAQPRTFLADGNLPSRIWQVIGVALIASAFSDVLIVTAIATGFEHLRPWIITLFSVGNLLLIGIISVSGHLQSEDTSEEEPDRALTVADEQTWQRVRAYMQNQRPYLDPDLTFARLSRKLGVPAKSVSTVINRETGENVSRFVNTARIAAAKKALLAGETVTTAMLSSGFNTKSNFNREFLRITGTNPSQWLASQIDPQEDAGHMMDNG